MTTSTSSAATGQHTGCTPHGYPAHHSQYSQLWANHTIGLTPPLTPPQEHQITQKTQRQRWLNHIMTKLAQHDYAQLETWSNQHPNAPGTPPQTAAAGCPEQCFRNTRRDHERRLDLKIPHSPTPPSSPSHTSSYSKTSAWSRICSQNSYVPTQIPSVQNSTKHGGTGASNSPKDSVQHAYHFELPGDLQAQYLARRLEVKSTSCSTAYKQKTAGSNSSSTFLTRLHH